MNEPEVLLELNGSVAILTLNRPKVLNALSRSLQLSLEKYIVQLENDDEVKCVIITGAGEKAFCAGGDIHEMEIIGSVVNQTSTEVEELREKVLSTIHQLPKIYQQIILLQSGIHGD